MNPAQPESASAFDELLEHVFRLGWAFRMEVVLAAVVVVTWVLATRSIDGLFSVVGVVIGGKIVPIIAAVITASGALVVLRVPRVRVGVNEVLAVSRIRRRAVRAFGQLQLRSFHGMSVQVNSVTRSPSGWVLLVRPPSGARNCDLDSDVADALAAVLRVRNVQLTRTADDAGLIAVRIVERELWRTDPDPGPDNATGYRL